MGQSDIGYFRILNTKTNKELTRSGTCALCGNAYKFGNRVIAEYRDTGTNYLLTEPFNLCDSCFEYHKAKQEGYGYRQTKLH